MSKIDTYRLNSTARIPNSHFPLLHYRGILSQHSKCDAVAAYDVFTGNGWVVNWIFRYGDTQLSHYHPRTHECMAVLSGEATIRFGVADTSTDLSENSYGSSWEEGGVELHAEAGDVFIIPAGVAHKTYRTSPAEFALLSPGIGKGIDAEDPQAALARVELNGFTMLGAYPVGYEWDFAVGDLEHSDWDATHAVPRPPKDPVFGESQSGLLGLWQARKECTVEQPLESTHSV